MTLPANVHTAADSRIYIGTTIPAATQGDYEGDTFAEIAEVETLGEYGRTYSAITFVSLANRNVRKFKGSRDDGNLELGLGKEHADAGQTALRAALDSDADYNFKITENDASAASGATPTTTYFRAKVMKLTTNINDPNSVVKAAVTLAIQSGTIIEVAAT